MINAANNRVGRSKSRSNNVEIIFRMAIVVTLASLIPTICMVQGFQFASRESAESYRIRNYHQQPQSSSSASYLKQSRGFGFHLLQQPEHASYLSSSSKLTLSISTDNNHLDAEEENDDTKVLQSQPKYNISLLLIDHYDSFTYNLYDMLAQLTVEPPIVVTKDAFDGWNDERWQSIDGIILSPGPGSPQEQPAFSKEAISCNPHTPILGVCLGHQLLALEYGANVDKAPIPIHGQDHWIRTTTTTTTTTSSLEDDTDDSTLEHPSIFDNVPSSFRAVRYHSLAAYDIPDSKNVLKVTATSAEDNVIQGLQHWKNPHYGVQFHPESIGTQHGMTIMENFCQVTQELKLESSLEDSLPAKPTTNKVNNNNGDESSTSTDSKSKFRVYAHAVKASNVDLREDEQVPIMEPVHAFETFYGDQPKAIWLDSSSASSSGRGQLDIMAAPTNPDDVIEHYVDTSSDAKDILTILEEGLFGDGGPSANYANASDQRVYMVNSDFETIRNEADDLRDMPDPSLLGGEPSEPLPFEYRGGYLGFLGYEVRHETQRFLQKQQQQQHGGTKKGQNAKANGSDGQKSSVPDSVFFLARQSMVYHHPTKTWYLIALVEEEEEVASSLEWMQQTSSVLTRNDQHKTLPKIVDTDATQSQPQALTFVPNRSKAKYQQDIAGCHEFIRMGESYELCLTNQLEAEVSEPLSTWNLYQTLRRRNPAPYAAFLRWNIDDDNESASAASSEASFAICSSSPERFMSVKRTKRHPLGSISLQTEAKPIKGTCARVEPQNGICLNDSESREDERRAQSLELSLKNRAENLMIVDLLRNDMSRVCQVGSVHVAKLMAIESFATVHQMVSTIRGTLSEAENTLDLLRASFPGGSMTGAPKLRTLELLEELEDDVNRGPYAGSLGYLSVNGCMDMNIIIRSAVVTPNENGGRKIAIGAGGAITALSEMEDEYEEMLLKARAVVEAVQTWATSGVDYPTLEDTAEVEKSFEV